MLLYIIIGLVSFVLGVTAFIFFIIHVIRFRSIKQSLKKKSVWLPLLFFILFFVIGYLSDKTSSPHFAMPPFMHTQAPGGVNPDLPFIAVISFFKNYNRFERVDDISQSPDSVPPAIGNRNQQEVTIKMKTKEVISEVSPGVYFNYWTYDGKVPGPFLRIKEGDTVILSLTNDESSLHHHNIDLHAVTGPGGGAVLTDVMPGETKTFKWKALNPGLYIYHCAMPNVSSHNSHGQYGLILVEPKEGLPPVDKEFYIVQGELYTIGNIGKKGLNAFDTQALIDGNPNYVTFNGRIDNKTPRLKAKVGDNIRIYVGNGGVNLISSFHVIGEIFDTVYPEGAMGPNSTKLQNVQTTAVLPGGSSIVEFKLDVPGKYLIVDHALARMNKGAWAILEVIGDSNPDIFSGVGMKNINNEEMGH